MTYPPSPPNDIIVVHCHEGRTRCVEPCPPDGIGTRPSMRPTKHMQTAGPSGGACIAHTMHHAMHIMHRKSAWARAGCGFARRPARSPATLSCANNGESEGREVGGEGGRRFEGRQGRGGRNALPAWWHAATRGVRRRARGGRRPLGRPASSCAPGCLRRRLQAYGRVSWRGARRHGSRG